MLFSKVHSVLFFVFEKTKQNKAKPKANSPSTKNNRKGRAKASSDDDGYYDLCEKMSLGLCHRIEFVFPILLALIGPDSLMRELWII